MNDQPTPCTQFIDIIIKLSTGCKGEIWTTLWGESAHFTTVARFRLDILLPIAIMGFQGHRFNVWIRQVKHTLISERLVRVPERIAPQQRPGLRLGLSQRLEWDWILLSTMLRLDHGNCR